MALVTAIFVGLIVAAGLYQLQRRNLFDIVVGIVLVSHGVNVALIAMGGWGVDQHPPILDPASLGEHPPLSLYADPLPQALILTALVIGFGLLSFLSVLVVRARESIGTLELQRQENKEDPQPNQPKADDAPARPASPGQGASH